MKILKSNIEDMSDEVSTDGEPILEAICIILVDSIQQDLIHKCVYLYGYPSKLNKYSSYLYKNQYTDIISRWVNVGHGIYIIYLKCFNRQGCNTMKTRGLIQIDVIRLCHRWCLIYLCCLVFMSFIVLGVSAKILNL